MLKKLTTFLGSFLVLTGVVYASHVERFAANLRGSEEVPPVTTQATGKISLRANTDDESVSFDLDVKNGLAVTGAHIHCGLVGQNGPVVAHLFGQIPGGFDVDGELAEYTLRQANIVANTCSPAITTIPELVTAMKEERAYVNVHTVANPNGEIRGQINVD